MIMHDIMLKKQAIPNVTASSLQFSSFVWL